MFIKGMASWSFSVVKYYTFYYRSKSHLRNFEKLIIAIYKRILISTINSCDLSLIINHVKFRQTIKQMKISLQSFQYLPSNLAAFIEFIVLLLSM